MIKHYIYTLTEIVLNVVEFLLLTRVVLKLLGARMAAPFVSWVYTTSDPLLAPFEGMFPTSTTGGGFTLEISTMFAILAYAFVGFLIQSAIIRLSPKKNK